MTELLSLVLQTASRLPDEQQDEIARAMLLLLDIQTGDDAVEPEDRAAVDEALAYLERREFASDDAVKAAWRRFAP
ncbi:MAG: hypothetical protein WB663_09900 [Beijerinckiaceae bacterium]|jgi:hypothetical protein